MRSACATAFCRRDAHRPAAHRAFMTTSTIPIASIGGARHAERRSCWHLSHPPPEIVRQVGYYSENDFRPHPLSTAFAPGRDFCCSCVHPDYRTGRTITCSGPAGERHDRSRLLLPDGLRLHDSMADGGHAAASL